MKSLPKKKATRHGATQSKEARRESGRVRLDMWWPEELVERLDAMRGERTRSEALQTLAALALGMSQGVRTTSATLDRGLEQEDR